MSFLKSLFSRQRTASEKHAGGTDDLTDKLNTVRAAGTDPTGTHYTDRVEEIKALKREGRYKEAIDVLLKCIDQTESYTVRRGRENESLAFSSDRTLGCSNNPGFLPRWRRTPRRYR